MAAASAVSVLLVATEKNQWQSVPSLLLYLLGGMVRLHTTLTSHSTCQTTQSLRLEMSTQEWFSHNDQRPLKGPQPEKFSARHLWVSFSRRKLGPMLSKFRHDTRIGSGKRTGVESYGHCIEGDKRILHDTGTSCHPAVEEVSMNVADLIPGMQQL